ASVSTEMALALKGRPTQVKRPIDRHVGKRLRAIRTSRGLSLQALADSTGIDEARLRAFEAGERIRPAGLYGLARTLTVLIAQFLVAERAEGPRLRNERDELADFPPIETARLLGVWRQLDPEAQRKALQVVQMIAGE